MIPIVIQKTGALMAKYYWYEGYSIKYCWLVFNTLFSTVNGYINVRGEMDMDGHGCDINFSIRLV